MSMADADALRHPLRRVPIRGGEHDARLLDVLARPIAVGRDRRQLLLQREECVSTLMESVASRGFGTYENVDDNAAMVYALASAHFRLADDENAPENEACLHVSSKTINGSVECRSLRPALSSGRSIVT